MRSPSINGADQTTGSGGNRASSLSERIHAGDRSAEAELVQRYFRPTLFMLQFRCHDKAQAEDLAQDTMSIVISHLREKPLDNPDALPKYIRQIAMNLFIGEYRKQQRQQTSTDQLAIDQTIAEQSSSYDAIHQNQRAKAVRQLLAELPQQRDRQILRLFYLAEQDKSTICERLKLSPAHFDRVLYRAKQRLRKLYDQQTD